MESVDALSGQIRRPGDRRDKKTMPFSNPVADPIVVEGAGPGDELKMTIERIEILHCRCMVSR